MWNEEAREARGLRRMSVTVSSPSDERKGRDWFHAGLSRCQGHDAKALSILRIILRKEVISNTIGFGNNGVTYRGVDEQGYPVVEVPNAMVLNPSRGADGVAVLPKAWRDGE